MQYVAYQLITRFGKQADVTALLQQMEFVIVPCMNPDGCMWINSFTYLA